MGTYIDAHTQYMHACIYISTFQMNFKDRGKEREREKGERERPIGCLPMHPDQNRNHHLFGIKNNVPPTKSPSQGSTLMPFNII